MGVYCKSFRGVRYKNDKTIQKSLSVYLVLEFQMRTIITATSSEPCLDIFVGHAAKVF